MGTLTTSRATVTVQTYVYVDAEGNILGDYAPKQMVEVAVHNIPDGAIGLPDAPAPPSRKHIWQDGAWFDPGPSEKELAQLKAAEDKEARLLAARAKLAALGLTEEDFEALK